MRTVIQTYGKELAKDLLDATIILSESADKSDAWRDILLKHEFIKRTTKVINARVYKNTVQGEYQSTDEGYKWVRTAPFTRYILEIKNGRSEMLIHASFKDTELNELLGELS